MTDYPDDEFAEIAHSIDYGDQLTAKVESYEVFLAVRGVDLNAPSDLGTSGVTKNEALRIVLTGFAMNRLIVDQGIAGGAPKVVADHLVHMIRLQMIAKLYGLNSWVEPWISLVNTEAPGDDPTPEEMEQIVAGLAEQITQDAADEQQRLRRAEEQKHFLASHGYTLMIGDGIALARIDSLCGTLAAALLPPELILSEAMANLQGFSDPTHPAIPEVIKQIIIPHWTGSS